MHRMNFKPNQKIPSDAPTSNGIHVETNIEIPPTVISTDRHGRIIFIPLDLTRVVYRRRRLLHSIHNRKFGKGFREILF